MGETRGCDGLSKVYTNYDTFYGKYNIKNMKIGNEYIIIESTKIAEIKYKALQKLAANNERPLSEASIEARAVIEVVNYIYENNEYRMHKTPEYIKPGMITINTK